MADMQLLIEDCSEGEETKLRRRIEVLKFNTRRLEFDLRMARAAGILGWLLLGLLIWVQSV